jgi:hypothetical protein
MTKNLLGHSVRRDVAKVNSSAGSCNNTGSHRDGRGRRQRCLHTETTSRGLGRVKLRGTISGRRHYSLVRLRRNGLLNRAGDTILLLVVSLLLLKSGDALKLRAGKSSRRTGLERAAEKQLRRQKGGKLHIKCSARGSHVHSIVRSLLDHRLRLGVDRRDVASSRMSVGEARDVGIKGAMRETSIAVGRLRGMPEAVGRAIRGTLANGSI